MAAIKRAATDESVSELPEPMIQHILSFLTPEEAARQTLLSKPWLSAWRTRPILCFNERHVGDRDRESQKMYKKSFWDALYSTFLRYRDQKIGIESFELRIHSKKLDRHGSDLIDRWIKLAVRNGVIMLELELNSYTLPPFLLEAKSLETLWVCGSNLKLQVTKNIQCNGLKVLHLSKVSLDEFMFQNIISSCNLIEYLTMDRCDGVANFKMAILKNLKDFHLVSFHNQIVEVKAPSLEFLTCMNSEDYPDTFRADELKPCLMNLSQCRGLKSLELRGVAVTFTFLFNLEDQFPHLEDLTIRHVHDMETVQISSHSLKTLNLESNYGLEELQIDTPRLVKFGYKGHTFPQISVTSASSHWVSDIYIMQNRTYLRMPWFLKLKKLLRDIKQSEIFLCLDFDDVSAFLNVKEVRHSPLSFEPQVQVQELSLSVYPTSAVCTMLNGVFWSCRPKTILMDSVNDSTISEFNWALFKILIVGRNQGSFGSEHIKLWGQDLKEVKVRILRQHGGRWKPESFDLENLLSTQRFNDEATRKILFDLEWEISLS